MTGRPQASFDELVAVVARTRRDCPWDASQTHRSLVTHLIEETGELVDALEAGMLGFWTYFAQSLVI